MKPYVYLGCLHNIPWKDFRVAPGRVCVARLRAYYWQSTLRLTEVTSPLRAGGGGRWSWRGLSLDRGGRWSCWRGLSLDRWMSESEVQQTGRRRRFRQGKTHLWPLPITYASDKAEGLLKFQHHELRLVRTGQDTGRLLLVQDCVAAA